MNNLKLKNKKKGRRQVRNRAKIFGTETKPRLSVFRSNRFTSAQLIDDVNGKTLAAASTREFTKEKSTKAEKAKKLGALLAEKAQKLGITKAVFNKGPYLYHGRVKAVAEGAREKGLQI
jgi:large subunit ribosomal protein L18